MAEQSALDWLTTFYIFSKKLKVLENAVPSEQRLHDYKLNKRERVVYTRLVRRLRRYFSASCPTVSISAEMSMVSVTSWLIKSALPARKSSDPDQVTDLMLFAGSVLLEICRIEYQAAIN